MIKEKIDTLIKSNPIVLFMKGTADFPQCGFSGKVVHLLSQSGIRMRDCVVINVLEDPEMRQGIKDYTQWPTIPQLYINGAFVGGCDIVTNLFEQGKLQEMLAAV